MTPGDALRVAWQGTSRRRLRGILTAASLMIGVLTLVVVQSAQTLVHEATLHRAILRNGPAATVRIGLDPAGSQSWWRARAQRLAPGAKLAAYNGYSSVNVSTNDGEPVSIDVAAVDPGLIAIRPFEVLAGSWLRSPRLAPQVVLNRAASAALPPHETSYWFDAPDGRLTVTITGVIDDGDPALNAYIATDSEPALAAAGMRPATRSLLVSGAGLGHDRLAGQLATVAELTGHSGEVTDVSRVDTVGEFDDQLATQRRIFLAIAVLCLIVGSLGILNIGLSVLRERAEELSLRRALGASRLTIAVIMMLESQIVAAAAAALAIAGAYLAVPWFLAHLTSVQVGSPSPPPHILALGVLASAVAALAGALAPSVRAALVPIATLLR
jgi:putative ABC transport system permease protein